MDLSGTQGIREGRNEVSPDDLAKIYLATIQAIACGTRHIIKEMNAQGCLIEIIIATGGGTKNPVSLREHADITGCRIILPREREAVLLGSADLVAMAAGAYDSVVEAMGAMTHPGEVIAPVGGKIRRYHDAKYEVFHQMYEDEMNYVSPMRDW